MIDPGIKGKELSTVEFPLDRSKLAELARALHDDDPVWHDATAAAAAGFDGVPVPPTATVLADHWRPKGALEHAIEVGMAPSGRGSHGQGVARAASSSSMSAMVD